MIKKLLLGSILLGVFLISCQKNATVQLPAASKNLKEKVIAFMDAKKSRVGEQAKATIEKLKGDIDWSDFSIGISPFFKSKQTVFKVKRENAAAKTSENTYTCLYVTQNSNGSVISVNTLEITMPQVSTGSLNSLALDLVNNNLQAYTGTLTKRNLSGYYIYEIEIENGHAERFRFMKKRNIVGKGQTTELTTTCVDWYWQTYENGILISEIFLFQDCSMGVEEGGNGSTNTGTTVYTPCGEVNSLSDNVDFRSKLDSLRSGWTNSYESGYSYTGTSTGGFNFTKYQGLPGEGVDVPTTGPVRGIIHNHNSSEPFSIFSPDDIRRMYQIFYNNHADTGFSYTLITNNTAYILKVSDLTAFTQFGQNHLEDQASFFSFSFFTYSSYGISTFNPANNNESGFLRMINGLGMGLQLFSASTADFQEWNRRGVDPGNANNVINVNCQ